jgi:hypothetical protein
MLAYDLEVLPMRSRLTLAGVAVLLAAIPVAAHHNTVAEYDATATVTLKGVVTRVDWSNPHVYIYIEVKDETGKVVNWRTEGYPPNTLTRAGFTRDIVSVGDTVTINGFRARDNTASVAAHELTTPDGRKFKFGAEALGDKWKLIL